VNNRGAATAQAVAVRISLAAALVASINVGALPAGASGIVATNLTAPSVPGTYTVMASASTSSQEVSTANNTTTATLLVTPTPTAPSASSCTKYQSFFDGTWTASRSTLESHAVSGDGMQYSRFAYALDGMAMMAEGTRQAKYIEQALTWAETVVSKATVVDKNGYRNWSGPWASPYSTTPIAYHLNDVNIGVPLSEVARVALGDPAWAISYGSRARAVRDFVSKHIVEKHFVSRSDRSWYWNRSISTTINISDRVPQGLQIVLNLSRTGVTAELVWAKSVIANWWKYHFEPWGSDAIIWDVTRNAEAPGHAEDTSHSNVMPYFMVRAHEMGIEPLLTLTQLSRLLLGTVWNGSLTNPMFTNYVDGVNDVFRTRTAYSNGQIYSGWISLGAYDSQLRIVGEAVLDAIARGQQNPSLNFMNTVWGKLELAGHATRSQRVAGVCR
jgi:hypothetical protein